MTFPSGWRPSRCGNPIDMECTAGSRNGHLTTASEHGPVCWLRRLIEAAGDRLFRTDDQTAIKNNWQITKRHGGLSRSYRDPGFDTLYPCFQCGGSGRTDRAPCAECDGTGRVTWADSYRERQLL
jgi:hypothetical protein